MNDFNQIEVRRLSVSTKEECYLFPGGTRCAYGLFGKLCGDRRGRVVAVCTGNTQRGGGGLYGQRGLRWGSVQIGRDGRVCAC